MPRRVVITGLGALSPRASGCANLWSLMIGSGRGTERPEPPALVALVPNAMLDRLPAQLRHLDRLGKLAIAATELALEDTAAARPVREAALSGIALGSAYGCLPTNAEYLESILERGARYGNPVVFQNTVTNAAAGYIAMVHDLQGPTATVCSGWTAGLEALGFAREQLEEGSADRMVVCGADTLTPQLLEALTAPGALSRSGRSRPVDESRDGMHVSEGACSLVLEEEAHAQNRGARVHAYLLGCAHRSGPPHAAASTLARAITEALSEARLPPERLGAVFVGANGRLDLDVWECQGLRDALGPAGARVPVTCPKAFLGETFSAGGLFGTLLSALALSQRVVPALGADTRVDPRCGELNLVRGASLPLESDWVLATSLGEDGSAAATVLGREPS